ncbi:MAG: sugar ABC transporter ATP-binding protein [Bryobacteraceae bacterium]
MPVTPGSTSHRPTDPPVLSLERITKRFSSTPALSNVDFSLETAEVHALVGENGAGKSTLIKILTGALQPDEGLIQLDGQTVHFRSPEQAQAAGIAAVYQEIHLLELRTVAENIYFNREPLRRGLIDWKRMNEKTRGVLGVLGLDVDPEATVGHLKVALRQMISIARCFSMGSKVVVLDEPTSSLSAQEVSVLYDVVRKLKTQGVSVIYVSHRFDELYSVCDRVTVLRDGKLVGTHRLSELERIDLVCLMLGKQRNEVRFGTTAFHRQDSEKDASNPVLLAENVAKEPRLKKVSVEVRSGQIVGLAGLLGSGRSETARVIFGADRPDSGAIYLDGQRAVLHSPRDSIRRGVGFLAEDRKTEGILPEASITENLTLAALPLLSRFGFISRRRQREVVTDFIRRLRIKSSNPAQKITELSGGNQQKVLLARWLCRNPKLLILDEPTRGIDVGARAEIQGLINELARQGVGVLMISAELEELIEACSRIVVLRDGRQVADLAREHISQQAIMAAMAMNN